jgi:GNAT superfamily N-acetyltransferase
MDLPFKVRAMLPADFGSADHIRFLIGWNQTLDDWERLFELAPDEGCFVAELNAEVAGTVTTIAYPNEVGWIGMLLVHPAYQRRGIGMHLFVMECSSGSDQSARYLQRVTCMFIHCFIFQEMPVSASSSA